jgi:hypothetical protein
MILFNNNNNNDYKLSGDLNNRLNYFSNFDNYFPKHNSCPHQNSCLIYIISAFLKPFLFGWLAQSSLQLSSKSRNLLTKMGPNLVMRSLLSSRSINFGLFIGCFAGVFKAINCLLRWSCDASHDWHSLISGANKFILNNRY